MGSSRGESPAAALDLFAVSLDELRARASAASAQARARLEREGRPTSMQAAPIILTGICTTRPICRHC